MVCFTGRSHCPASRGVRLGPADPQAKRVSRPSLPFPAGKHSLLTPKPSVGRCLAFGAQEVHPQDGVRARGIVHCRAGCGAGRCVRGLHAAACCRASGAGLKIGARVERCEPVLPEAARTRSRAWRRRCRAIWYAPECSAETASDTHPRTLAWAASGTHTFPHTWPVVVPRERPLP
jgi:hypothetical protein